MTNNLQQHHINEPAKHIESNDPRTEFAAMEPFLRGIGIDIGTGTNRLSPTVLGVDYYPHEDADMLWNCMEDGELRPYPFRDGRFDFVFSSHVLEDFPMDQIQDVFDEWLRLVKPGGYLVLLVPDMEGKRYPDVDEVFTNLDHEVISGERQAGELKGNPSHRITMGMTLLKMLLFVHPESKLVQADTLPHNQCTLDFVIKK